MHFWALVFLFAAAALVGVIGKPVWPGEIFLSLLPQIGLGALLTSLLLFGLGRPLPAFCLIGCFALCLISAKGMFGSNESLEEPRDFRILWANVLKKKDSLQRAFNHAETHDADMVLITETPAQAQLHKLSEQHPEYRYVRGAIFGEDSAISIFSKGPINGFKIVEVDGRNGVVFHLESNNSEIAIGVVHPTIPSTPSRLQRRNDHILKTLEELKNTQPRLLLGDFNTVPWSPVARQLQSAHGLQRVKSRNASTWVSTFPFIGLPLDLAFASEDLEVSAYAGPAIGSDHFPLMLDIAVSHTHIDN